MLSKKPVRIKPERGSFSHSSRSMRSFSGEYWLLPIRTWWLLFRPSFSAPRAVSANRELRTVGIMSATMDMDLGSESAVACLTSYPTSSIAETTLLRVAGRTW